jgi:hypothetical protein
MYDIGFLKFSANHKFVISQFSTYQNILDLHSHLIGCIICERIFDLDRTRYVWHGLAIDSRLTLIQRP